MSLPDITLRCDRCDLAGAVYGALHDLAYVIDGHDVPMSIGLGCCNGCNSIGRIMERFDDALSIEIEIHEAQAAYLNHAVRFWNRWFSKRRLHELATHVRALELRQNLIAERKGSERCILCGSHAVTRFSGKYDLPLDETGGFFEGRRPTGFIHPGCGGEIWAQGSDVRFFHRTSAYRFNADGQRIHE